MISQTKKCIILTIYLHFPSFTKNVKKKIQISNVIKTKLFSLKKKRGKNTYISEKELGVLFALSIFQFWQIIWIYI